MSKDLNENMPVNPFETSVFSGMWLDNDLRNERSVSDVEVDLSSIKETTLDGFQIPVESVFFEIEDSIEKSEQEIETDLDNSMDLNEAAASEGAGVVKGLDAVSDDEIPEEFNVAPESNPDDEIIIETLDDKIVTNGKLEDEEENLPDDVSAFEPLLEVETESIEAEVGSAEKANKDIHGFFSHIASGVLTKLGRKVNRSEENAEPVLTEEDNPSLAQSEIGSDGPEIAIDSNESTIDAVGNTVQQSANDEELTPDLANEGTEELLSDESEGFEEASAALIRIAPKSMTIQGQLQKRNETVNPEEAEMSDAGLSFGLEGGNSSGIRENLRKRIKSFSTKNGHTVSFLQNKSFRRFGAVAAIFALLIGSVCYFGSLIKSADAITARSISYLFSEDSPQRVAVADPLSSDLIERAVQVYIRGSSVEEDLNLVVTDFSGDTVTGVPFEFSITDPKEQVQKYTDEDKDGELNIDGLTEGDYTVELMEAEGFIAPEPIVVKVQPKVEYVRIDNISEKIVDQDQVDLSEDDMQYGGRDPSGGTPVTTGDTVEYVPSSSKEVEKEKTRTVTKFTGHVDESGRLYYSSGELSNVIPVIDSEGYITGEYSLYQEVYTLTVVAESGGTATASMTSAAAYTEISVSAVPADGYVFAGWSCSAGDNPFADPTAAKTTFLMPPSNVTITASFAPAQTTTKEYTLTVSSGNGGTASASTSKVAAGTSVSITAIPSDGYVFAGWSSSGGGTFTDVYGSSTTFIMPANNVTITASFAVDTSGGAVGGDVNIFAKDANGNYVFDITAETVVETYTEVEIVYYGWQNLDGKTYYFDKNGKKVHGTQVIQGVTYVFAADGSLVKGDAVLGIDVSTWQGSIDWNAVAKSGIKYVFIRIGFRGYGTGKIVEDNRFLENIRGAKAAGLRVGVYFYSQAINAVEAVEEASATLELLRGYSVDYPIIIDMEDAGSSSARTVGLTRSELTKITVAFCETVRNSGYAAMVYANKYWLEYKLDPSQFGRYYIWLAHYTGGSASSYSGRYEVWQYTSVGKVNGISGNVDMNYSYMG